MIKAIEIKPDETARLVEVGNDLKSLQAAVGGYLEVISLHSGAVALVDEEAKLKRDPPPANDLATLIALGGGIHPDDRVLGTMIIVGVREGSDQFHDVPDRWIDDLCPFQVNR